MYWWYHLFPMQDFICRPGSFKLMKTFIFVLCYISLKKSKILHDYLFYKQEWDLFSDNWLVMLGGYVLPSFIFPLSIYLFNSTIYGCFTFMFFSYHVQCFFYFLRYRPSEVRYHDFFFHMCNTSISLDRNHDWEVFSF